MGIESVKNLFKYLKLPISEDRENIKGRVFCLTDTDSGLITKDITQNKDEQKKLVIKRLSKIKGGKFETILTNFEKSENKDSIDIEESLNPIIFKETLTALGADEKFLAGEVQNSNGNTTPENLRNFDIKEYFTDEGAKNDFANKYIDILGNKKGKAKEFIPEWVEEIKEFFNNK